MKIEINFYPNELSNVDLLGAADALNSEIALRQIKQPISILSTMSTAEFKTLLNNVLAQAEKRSLPISGYTKIQPVASVLPDLDDAEMALVETGKKIQAIKHYRDRYSRMYPSTGVVGLKDAKDQIDNYYNKWSLTLKKPESDFGSYREPRGNGYGY